MVSLLSAVATRARILVTRLLIWLGFREDGFLLFVAVLIGLAVAGMAIAFHELINLIRHACYRGVAPETLYGAGIVLLIVWPTVGGLVVGFLTQIVFRARSAQGIVDVMESVARGRVSLRPGQALERVASSSVTVGTGGSAGAEGPIVQIGATIASAFGQMFGLSRTHLPVVIGCGTAAGISAIFNAPIGGVLYTLEVILRDFSIRAFMPVVIASVIANITTRTIFEQLGYASPSIFQLTGIRADARWTELGNFIVLGMVCGVVAAAFTALMHRSERWFQGLRFPALLKPALGGAMVGVMGVAYIMIFGWFALGTRKPVPVETYALPAFFSDGYGFIQSLFTASFYDSYSLIYAISFLAFLICAKIAATCFTLGSSGGGGAIAPALFLGSVQGAMFGLALRATGWFQSLQPSTYALVGMGAVLAAVMHAPLASILILMELTDYTVALPAMLASVFAVAIARRIVPESLYGMGLRLRGISHQNTPESRVLRQILLEQTPLEPARLLQKGDPLQRAVEQMSREGATDFVVLDSAGHYTGMIVAEDVLTALVQREAVPLLIVDELVRPEIPWVNSTDDLAHTLDVFSQHNVDRLPVCLGSSPGKVVGMISRRGLMKRYQAGLQE
jgi:CIC family chloride channel protein